VQVRHERVGVGEYVNAGGVRTYYETHGEGEPLVLLHGGLATAESWAMQIPAFADRYRVYVPERRGHGRTPDVAGPMTYEMMAEDTAAFLDAAVTGTAHLSGWSDGAVVGMLVALRRPELVRKLVVIGQYFNFDGQVPEFRAMLDYWSYNLPEELHELYDRVSPDGPEHFPVVLEKMMRMWSEEPDISLPELAGVRVPTLVMQGDDDIVKVEHSTALAATLPDAQLAIIPGSSHMAPLEKPDLVNRLILDFLSDHQPEKMMSLRG
jgi:pimeloyl-ACP methyl ester carboxylesterase